MKKELHFILPRERKNFYKLLLLNIFWVFGSIPAMILEPFVRRKMGVRHFSLSACYTIAALMLSEDLYKIYKGDYSFTLYNIGREPIWYAFVVAFLYMAIQRHRESRQLEAFFDMNYYSLSRGEALPFVKNLHWRGKQVTVRQQLVYVEPAIGILAGVVLLFLDMHVGGILIVSSICYGGNAAHDLYMADQQIYHDIDTRIAQEQWANAYVDEKPISETHGFAAYGRRPVSKEFRRKIFTRKNGGEDEPDTAR